MTTKKAVQISILTALFISAIMNLFILINFLQENKKSILKSRETCTNISNSGCCILSNGVVSCASVIDD
jgi:amino acid permease